MQKSLLYEKALRLKTKSTAHAAVFVFSLAGPRDAGSSYFSGMKDLNYLRCYSSIALMSLAGTSLLISSGLGSLY